MVGESLICVAAPSTAVSRGSGQIGEAVLDGFYSGDRRLIDRLRLTVDGREPEVLRHRLLGAGSAEFTAIHRTPFDHVTGPTVTITRIRDAAELSETIVVRNQGRQRLTCHVQVDAGTDLAELSQIRAGRMPGALPAEAVPDGLRWTAGDGSVATITARPRPPEIGPRPGSLSWPLTLDPGQRWTLTLHVTTSEDPDGPNGASGSEGAGVSGGGAGAVSPSRNGTADVGASEAGGGSFAAVRRVPWARAAVRAGDPGLGEWWARSLADLEALLLADASHPDEVFVAAGAPWYLTLFGRDAIWAARMLLPLGTGLAAGTLRALARRQGRRYDSAAEEAPGKIVHEVRRTATAPYQGLALPPLYYGSIDATPLFVTLLAEAWRWGMPADQVAGLLPAAERALGWLEADADPDGDGFCEYVHGGATGLANQGWKDTPDAIQFADGTLAKPPIALAEVQGYAYQAAVGGADLLAAFGRPGAERWRGYAERLRERFDRAFWIDGEAGPYVAVALDGDKRPVDGVASNMGHLLSTGILTPPQAAHVAARLATGAMDSGRGLRTLAAGQPGFNPLSYHCGSVWAHDTAIAVAGLAATGHAAPAAALFHGVLAAAPAFGYRLPELWAGDACAPGDDPLPYPGACRPQAWAAASPILMLTSLLGIHPDVPAGRITVRPVHPWPLGEIDVLGLTVAGQTLSLHVGADGTPQILTAPAGLACVAE
jgi:glycogen debranching enzyme